MKIRDSLFAKIEGKIVAFVDTKLDAIREHIAKVLASGNYKKFDERILYDIGNAALGSKFIVDNVYTEGCNDKHLLSVYRGVISRKYPDLMALILENKHENSKL